MSNLPLTEEGEEADLMVQEGMVLGEAILDQEVQEDIQVKEEVISGVLEALEVLEVRGALEDTQVQEEEIILEVLAVVAGVGDKIILIET